MEATKAGALFAGLVSLLCIQFFQFQDLVAIALLGLGWWLIWTFLIALLKKYA